MHFYTFDKSLQKVAAEGRPISGLLYEHIVLAKLSHPPNLIHSYIHVKSIPI
jgi:hypothetical protein